MPLATSPKTKFGRWRLYGLTLTLPILLAMYHPVQEHFVRQQVLTDQHTPYHLLEQFAASFPSPTEASRALWDTSWLAHRHFAIEWLYRQEVDYAQMRPFMVACLSEPDGDLRETAMLWLTANHMEENLPLLAPLLYDPDPRVARFAAVLVGRYGRREHAGWFQATLESPEEGNKLQAYAAYQRWSGHDDGISLGSKPGAIAVAHQHWTEWLAEQHGLLAFPAEDAVTITALPTLPPTVVDATGSPLNLDSWGKRPILLVFWSAIEENSLLLVESMKELAALGCDADIVTLCIDDLPARHVGASDNLAAQQPAVGREMDWAHLSAYTTLDTLVTYRAHNPPVTVLIDTHGKVQRRLDYVRSPEGLQAMVDAMADSPPVTMAGTPDK